MPASGPLQPGRMRVVVPERPERAAVSAGEWTLRSWPMPDPVLQALRAETDALPGEVTPENLYVNEGRGCLRLVYRAGQRVHRAGLITIGEAST